MPSSRDIKNRIRSIANTKQITKAMEVVAATKMRRSQELAISTRPFAIEALRILKDLSLPDGHTLPELMTTRPVKRTGLIVISSDKGLAGSFNSNALRKAELWLKDATPATPVDVVTIGKKAREYFERRSANVIKSYVGAGDYGSLDHVEEIADFISAKFLDHNWDQVVAIYTHFRSTLKQEVVVRTLLPLTRSGVEELIRGILPEHGRYADQNTIETIDYEHVLEPSAETVLTELLPFLFQIEIYHTILESNASEHSARMIAMKKASDNASEIIGDLTLQYNKSRQASITQELIEITSGTG